MFPALTRREFLAAAAAMPGMVRAVHAEEHSRELKKAVIVKRPTAKSLAPVAQAGFDGVEAGIVSEAEAKACRHVAEDMGMRIHSVLRGWAQFNSDDRAKVESTWQTSAAALRAARGYGADAVLLVPGRIGGMAMPQPWEFRVQFDPESGHIRSVVEGDNAPYRKYIEVHNESYDRFRSAIQRLIPVAEKTGVVIAVENVWNNLFVDPAHFAHFIDSFSSPWVKVYFDIGNHVKYSPPQRWIRTLGSRIVKCHVKDFKLNADGHGGKFVNIRDGSVDWPTVRAALREVGYRGWMTIEGSGGLSMKEKSKRLDDIIAGR